MIRNAKLSDIPWMLIEAIDFVKMATEKEGYYNREHLKKLLTGLITSGVVYTDEHEGIIRGVIGGLVAPNLYNPDFTDLQELFWWVAEPYRNTSIGYRLLLKFVQYGIDNKVDNIVVPFMDVSPINRNSLEKRGFRLREQSWVMEN